MVGWCGTHLARPYTYALEHPPALDLEHAFLITIGICFWWPVIVPGERRMGSGVAVLYLLGAFVGASFLGLAYTFIPSPLYPYYVPRPGSGASRRRRPEPRRRAHDRRAVGRVPDGGRLTLLRLLDEEERRSEVQTAAALAAEAAKGPRPRKKP